MIQKYEGLDNTGYITDDNGKLKAFIALDNNNERIDLEVFATAVLAQNHYSNLPEDKKLS